MRDIVLVVPRMPSAKSVSGVGNYAEKLRVVLSDFGVRVTVVAPVAGSVAGAITPSSPHLVPVIYSRTIHKLLKLPVELLGIKGVTRLWDDILKAWYIARFFRNRPNRFRNSAVQVTNHKLLHVFIPRRRVFTFIVRLSASRRLWDDADKLSSLSSRIIESLDVSARGKADFVISPSRFLVRYYQRCKPHIEYLPSPVLDRDPRNPDESAPDEKYLLHYGTLSVRKGTDVLLRNLEQLSHAIPDFKLMCVGTFGSSLNSIQRAKMLDLRCIEYRATVPHELMLKYVREAHAVVIPSRADNLPNAFSEAVVLGRMVILPYNTGVDELSFFYPRVVGFAADDDISFIKAVEKAWCQPSAPTSKIWSDIREGIDKNNRMTAEFYTQRLGYRDNSADCPRR